MALARACVLLLLLASPELAFRVRHRRAKAGGSKKQHEHGHIQVAATEEKASNRTIYIMGYGSLMKESSRIRTTCGVSLPSNDIDALRSLFKDDALVDGKSECFKEVAASKMILVHFEGARRGWYQVGGVVATWGGNVEPEEWEVQGLDVSPTYLGAEQDESSSMYAVVYKVSQHELEATDRREGGYDHVWADATKVKRLDGVAFEENAEFRWYASRPERVGSPTTQKPICQSYVDVWLSGALELESANNVTDYVKNVVNTTYGWTSSWVNDRPTPYRAFTREPAASRVSSRLLEVARSTNNTVTTDPKMQPLTLDILTAIRFPGLSS